MKLLLALSLLTFSMLALSCTDFSGTFKEPKDGTEAQIIQAGCSTLTIVSEKQTSVFNLDGAYHEFFSQDIIIEGQVVAKMKGSSRANFEADKLILDIKLHIESSVSNSPDLNKDEVTRNVVSLNADNDLVSVTTRPDGTTDTAISKRVK